MQYLYWKDKELSQRIISIKLCYVDIIKNDLCSPSHPSLTLLSSACKSLTWLCSCWTVSSAVPCFSAALKHNQNCVIGIWTKALCRILIATKSNLRSSFVCPLNNILPKTDCMVKINQVTTDPLLLIIHSNIISNKKLHSNFFLTVFNYLGISLKNKAFMEWNIWVVMFLYHTCRWLWHFIPLDYWAKMTKRMWPSVFLNISSQLLLL